MQVLRSLLLAAALAGLFATAPLPAEAQSLPPVDTARPVLIRLSDMLMKHYDGGTIDQAVETLQAFYALNLPDGRTHDVVVAFVAGLIAKDHRALKPLHAVYKDLQPDHRALGLGRAVVLSGRGDTRVLLVELAKLWPERASDVSALRGETPLERLDPLYEPGVLDWNWAFYGATGALEPIERIVGALAALDDTEAPQRMIIAYSAKWSLAANAMRLPGLARMLGTMTDGPLGAAVADALKAAAEGNPERIRAEAIAATKAAMERKKR